MFDSIPPQRMRHSYENRCRVIRLVLDGLSIGEAAAVCGVSRATGYRLRRRYEAGGFAALRDRSSAPRRCPHRLSADAEAQILELRRRTGWGPRMLAVALGRPASTISRVLVRHGASRRAQAPRPAANRYEHPYPGSLVHLDTKKLGRFHTIGKRIYQDGRPRSAGAGWQHAHVAVDDHSRLVVCELYPAEDTKSCCAFVELIVTAFADQGIRIERVMTDNGSAYRSRAFKASLARHGIRHKRTRPYTPRTNGKAEAFIRTLQREWAYANAYPSSSHRARALPGYIRWYNRHRPHTALAGHPPTSRVSHAAGFYN